MTTLNRKNSVEQLEVLLELAKDMGYEVRYESLGGIGGGTCEYAGRKCLFVDLTLGILEQLDFVSRSLGNDPQVALYEMTRDQESALQVRKAA
ncbi:MAG: hypothetical protein MK106_11420 [Mariniblastus sp.]|nr:hypothetical protein [Mariniblastus sp.]